MSTSAVTLTPPSSPAPAPKTPIGNVLETPITKAINDLALPFIPSPKRKLPTRESRAPASAIRNLNYAIVIHEFSRSRRFIPLSPQPDNSIPIPLPAVAPSDSASPRAQQPTPHRATLNPSPPLSPLRERKVTPRQLFPKESSVSSTSTPSIDQATFDNILRTKITNYEIAEQTYAVVKSCLSLADMCKGQPEKSEGYLLDAQTLLYKILNFHKSTKQDERVNLLFQAMCEIDMVETSSDVDLRIYWFNEGLNNLDDFFENSFTRQEIGCCQQLYENILDLCPSGPGVSADFEEISAHSMRKYSECASRLEQLNEVPEAPLVTHEELAAEPKISTRITIRRIFVFTMTLLIAGLAIAERTRIRNALGNALGQFSNSTEITSLFNRLISTFEKYTTGKLKKWRTLTM